MKEKYIKFREIVKPQWKNSALKMLHQLILYFLWKKVRENDILFIDKGVSPSPPTLMWILN